MTLHFNQHWKIITDRSSKGISHWFLLLGSVSSFANLCNAFILQYPLFSCCSLTVQSANNGHAQKTFSHLDNASPI